MSNRFFLTQQSRLIITKSPGLLGCIIRPISIVYNCKRINQTILPSRAPQQIQSYNKNDIYNTLTSPCLVYVTHHSLTKGRQKHKMKTSCNYPWFQKKTFCQTLIQSVPCLKYKFLILFIHTSIIIHQTTNIHKVLTLYVKHKNKYLIILLLIASVHVLHCLWH